MNDQFNQLLDTLLQQYETKIITKQDLIQSIINIFNPNIQQNYYEQYSYNKLEVNKDTKPIIEIKNLTKKYHIKSKPVINNISFNIYPGNFHAFIGANGSGKTTTIKSIIGAYSKLKYEGEILINGKSNQLIESKKLIGYVPEKTKFPSNMSTIKYLEKMCVLSGYQSTEAKKIANELITKLNLAALANKNPHSLSSGQKKKILLAQALIHNPDILIMDEPAANLDPIARKELFDNLIELQSQGKTIFLSSHILDEIGKYATYATILDGGKIVYSDYILNNSLADLYYHYVKIGSVDTNPDLVNNDKN